MGDLINNIISAPVANLLIIAGIAFLGLAVVGKIVGKIEPGKTGRLVSGCIGIVLLIVGLFMHLGQTKVPKQSEYKPSATQTKTKEQPSIPKTPDFSETQTKTKEQSNTPKSSGLSETQTKTKEQASIPKTPDFSETQTETKEQTNVSRVNDLPDLFVSEFSVEPKVPIQGRPVAVRIGVYNKGNKDSGPFKVQWWAGENFPKPEHEWRIRGLPARGGRILKYTYSGYRSWYARINTKVIIDPENRVKERDKKNNIFKTNIGVRRQRY